MDLKRRFRISLMVYAVLAIAIWFSMSGETFQLNEPFHIFRVSFHGSFRALALIVLGLFALKTFLHWKAEQIRGSSGEGAGRE